MLTSPEIRAFRKAEVLRNSLDAAMQTPALKSALEHIERAALPKGGLVPIPGIPFDSTVSHEYHKSMGIVAAIQTLRAMTYQLDKAPSERVDEDEEEFDHSLPPDLQLKNRPKVL